MGSHWGGIGGWLSRRAADAARVITAPGNLHWWEGIVGQIVGVERKALVSEFEQFDQGSCVARRGR